MNSDDAWAIALRFYSGPAHQEQAQSELAIVSRETGRSDARVRTRERGSVIVAGRYGGPGDSAALTELARIKKIERDGNRPYSAAYLAPPLKKGSQAGANEELNLETAKARYGADRAVYTLEYASFDKGSASSYQSKAESEARRLRDAGERAFYFHGRSSSSVTIGLFDETAIDRSNRFSSEVDFLQRRFKFLLRNGERIDPEGKGTFWPTRLVRVPG